MTTVIISGVNTGIGLGILKEYAARIGYTVIGTILPSTSIGEVKVADGSRVITVEMDLKDVEAPKRAVEELRTKHGVDHFDIVVSNAGVFTPKAMSPIVAIDPQAFEDHWRVNVKGNLVFFQACIPNMRSGAKFIFIASSAAMLDRVPDKQNVCYGITKIGATYLARYAHFEHPDLTIFPLSPGWVATAMGKLTAQHQGLENAPVTVDDSASGIVKVIDQASRDTHGGLPWNYDGSKGRW